MRIRRDALEVAIQHARSCAPYECCGALFGSADCIMQIAPTRNTARELARFELDPLDFLALLKARQQRIIGFYHSHPDTADRGPSAADRSSAATEFAADYHLIVSPSGEWTIYRVRGAHWSRVTSEVIDG